MRAVPEDTFLKPVWSSLFCKTAPWQANFWIKAVAEMHGDELLKFYFGGEAREIQRWPLNSVALFSGAGQGERLCSGACGSRAFLFGMWFFKARRS